MKFEHLILILLMILSFFLFYYASDEKESFDTTITRVVDGDTLVISDGSKVRLKGINTPEKNQLFSPEAVEFLEGFVNRSVEVVSYGKDKYGRILGYVFVNGKNLNEEILTKGLGHLYYYEHDKYFDDLKSAEEIARGRGRGIWTLSKNYGCLEILEFDYFDEGEEIERLVLENSCESFDIVIKDDATHIYEERIEGLLVKETQNIWNDDGDSIYIWDGEGLVLFERYS